MNVATDTPPAKSWPDYRAVWRWHFYASLFCIPFVVILSITGGIYLFKPQIEAWNERAFDNLKVDGAAKPAADQIQAALAAVPDSTLKEYELPQTTTSAARVVVRDKEGAAIRTYVHPVTLAVLHNFPDNDRFSRLIFRIHGELLMGDRGSLLVELAASWTIIMILTGLYLWWPRNNVGLGGTLYPRLTAGKKVFWRDIHSVTGIWLSGFTLFFLLSGLPWAKSWGNYLKAVRSLTNTAVAQQEWSNTSEAVAKKKPSGEHAGHGDHGGGPRRNRAPAKQLSPEDLAAVDRIAATLQPLNLAHPVVIAPPAGEAKTWTAKSMTANRPYRENLVVDGETGAVISRDGFRQKHAIDQLVSIGIAAHEGALFGWPNQALGLLTVLGLLLICCSGLILWWRRRDQGLGAPKAALSPSISIALVVIVVALGIYLPLFGASLVAVFLGEWLILRRIPAVRDWLGLQKPAASALATAATIVLVVLGSAGCGGPKPITGGTPGVLRAGPDLLAEVQLTLHAIATGTPEPIGFAVTRADGSFELVTNGAKEPLRLAPGQYRCTIESAGSPLKFPAAYANPATTPLQVIWTPSDVTLNLDVKAGP